MALRRTIPVAPHGGPQAGDEPAARFDFSSSTVARPPDALIEVVRGADLSSYPPVDDDWLRREIGAARAVPPGSLVLGPGTAELIYRISQVCLAPGDEAWIAGPTFGEFARAARVAGAGVREFACDPPGGPLRSRTLIARLRRTKQPPRLVWLCQPNNPSGRAWAADELRELATTCRNRGSQLVVDAAYLPLSEARLPRLPRTVVLHSLTKAFGVPGLRVGLATAPAALAARLRSAAPPWPLSNAAIAGLRWMHTDSARSWLEQAATQILAGRRALAGLLEQGGLIAEPSAAGFLLCRPPDGDWRSGLQAEALRVREIRGPGNLLRLRLADRGPKARRALTRAWQLDCVQEAPDTPVLCCKAEVSE